MLRQDQRSIRKALQILQTVLSKN